MKRIISLTAVLIAVGITLGGCASRTALILETGGVLSPADGDVAAEINIAVEPETEVTVPGGLLTGTPGTDENNGLVTEPETVPETEPPVTEPPETEPPVTEPPETEPPVTEPPETEPPVTEPPETEPPVTEPPETEPPVTEYDWKSPVPYSAAVTDGYFEDVAFIGDSLTVGLMTATGWNATKLSKVGACLYRIVNGNEMIDLQQVTTELYHSYYQISPSVLGDAGTEGTVTYDSLLPNLGSPRVIYICLGANDVGIGNVALFKSQYIQLIIRLRELYPGAQLCLQSILPFSAEKSAENAFGANERIRAMNAVIASLCNTYQLYFIDTYSVIADAEGNLPANLTADGVHLTRTGYLLWRDYLMTHTTAAYAAGKENE